MKLLELEPKFLKLITEVLWQTGVSFQEADGIEFLCPKCFLKGRIGCHMVVCWKPHVPQTVRPTPGRWELHGSGFDDLTLVAKSSSIKITSGCLAHFFIRNGNIEDC
jgi:hypothetical protein